MLFNKVYAFAKVPSHSIIGKGKHMRHIFIVTHFTKSSHTYHNAVSECVRFLTKANICIVSTFAHTPSNVPMTCFETVRPQRWNDTEASVTFDLWCRSASKHIIVPLEGVWANVDMMLIIALARKGTHSETELWYVWLDFVKWVTMNICRYNYVCLSNNRV